jgi:hypothetical protein
MQYIAFFKLSLFLSVGLLPAFLKKNHMAPREEVKCNFFSEVPKHGRKKQKQMLQLKISKENQNIFFPPG